jgi:hypothetical protein
MGGAQAAATFVKDKSETRGPKSWRTAMSQR